MFMIEIEHTNSETSLVQLKMDPNLSVMISNVGSMFIDMKNTGSNIISNNQYQSLPVKIQALFTPDENNQYELTHKNQIYQTCLDNYNIERIINDDTCSM